jgi:hypothetical protein
VLLSNSLLATVNEKLSGYTGAYQSLYIRIVIICKVIANAVRQSDLNQLRVRRAKELKLCFYWQLFFGSDLNDRL